MYIKINIVILSDVVEARAIFISIYLKSILHNIWLKFFSIVESLTLSFPTIFKFCSNDTYVKKNIMLSILHSNHEFQCIHNSIKEFYLKVCILKRIIITKFCI